MTINDWRLKIYWNDEGKADENKDKKITNGELIAYLKANVSKEAFTQNREQDPMLSGDPNKVLMSYR